jgi:amidohydrolase
MELKVIRQKLHTLAELSGKESQTAHFVKSLLQKYNPTMLWINIGGHGVLAHFEFAQTGPKILIRADLDALPHQEGASHKCGHDGHMTLALSLLDHLKEFKQGSLFLFFQPAEETGAGARASLQDPIFQDLKLDAVFGLHNLPGLPSGEVVLLRETFACSSVGLKIKIQGRSSHAAEPQKAHSPFPLMQELSLLCQKLINTTENEKFQLATLTHLKLGDESFGITPGYGEVFITLRAVQDTSIEEMKKEIESLVDKYDFEIKYEEHDYFPATTVDPKIVSQLEKLFSKKNISYRVHDFPFRWSEDFGYFTQKYPGVYFGLGSGENCKPLHDTHYEFPDDLLKKGALVYQEIVGSYLA